MSMNHYDDDEPGLSLRARLAMTGWIGTGLAGLLTAANHRRNQCSQRGTTVKCWLFQNPDPTGRGNA